MKLFTNIAAFAVVATVACLREAIAAREFFLRMYADNCGDLPDLDGNGEDNGRGNDALIQLWINGKEVDEFAYYRPNTNSPNWNWATNILQDVALGSTIEYRLNDYDRNEGNRQEYIGKLTFKLPTNPNVWSSSQFGYRGKYGDTRQQNLDRGGWCRFKVQFYANQCEIGEYVDAKGYCVSCDQGFFCPDGVSKALCDAGTFASGRGATTSCATCPAGTYQPGRGQSECLPCPDGEYSSGTSNSKCSLCREGYYGKGNAARTSDTCTGKCTQGYYCPKGSSSAKQNECGGINLFCPTGSPLPKVVSDGYYTYSRSGDDNNVNARINQRECEPGYKCKGGAKIACGENEYVEGKAAETCNSCLDLSCTQHKFRAGCGGGSKGTCTDCKIRPATQSQECTTGFNKCPGNTLIDVSACKECECTDPGLQWKKLESSGSCPKCMPCTYTESNCNDADAGNVPNDPTNNMYLEDACRADSSTNKDSSCSRCDAYCASGEHFNEDCGGLTPPSCTVCKRECGGCSGKGQGDCAAPICLWSGSNCLPHPLLGQFIDPSSLCSGKELKDTTSCLDCNTVQVPSGKFMVNCQQTSDDARFKALTKCIRGSTFESQAPTRTSDRVCSQCTPCKEGEYQAIDCDPSQDNLCVPVSVPGDGFYVFETATATKDAVILPIQDCSQKGQWEDLTQPYEKGSAYVPGSDVTCYDYNECNLKYTYVVSEANETADFQCGLLNDCELYAQNQSAPVFSIVRNSRTWNRECMRCDAWNKEDIVNLTHFDLKIARSEWEASCAPNIDTQMTSGAKIGIALGALVCLGAVMAIHLQQKRKREIALQKEMADKELDRAKDELELGENMMKNPMKAPNIVDNTALIQKGKQADAEILKLREEVRRLKMMAQRKAQMSTSTRGIKMAKAPSRKKEFGQTR